MKLSKVDRRLRRGCRGFELLESRCLLSATLTAAIPAQTVFSTAAPVAIDLSQHFNDPLITGTTVLIQTNDGNIPVLMHDSLAPLTVANFLRYVDSAEYNDIVFHRVVAGFVDQAGGFTTSLMPVNSFGTVKNEFVAGNPAYSNIRGTLAMAKIPATDANGNPIPGGGPDSASDQWFINEGNNSANLDNQNGGFTVFANVLYNGMSVADAINALPTTTAMASDGETLSGFPVQAMGDTPSPTNDVVVDSISRVPGLSYSISNDNNNVLTATITNGMLTLTPVSGAKGLANVTITATDLGGGTAQTIIPVDVTDGSTLDVPIGTGAATKTLTYTDANGTAATLSYKGPGSAVVHFAGAGLSQSVVKKNTVIAGTGNTISEIDIANSTSASSLSVATKGGTGQINVGIITTGAVKTIAAKNVTLTGNLTATGNIGSLQLAAAQDGTLGGTTIGTLAVTGSFADIFTLSGNSAGVALGKFTAGAIAGSTWGIDGSINSIAAGGSANWSGSITGNVKSLSIKGDLTASLSLGSVSSARIVGSLINSNLSFAGTGQDLSKLSVTGAINGTMLNATGNIGAVSGGSLVGSQIFAGVGNLPPSQGLPQSTSDYLTAQTIASVKVGSFTSSDIAAKSLGKLSLGTVQTVNGGAVEGVSAVSGAGKHAGIASLNGVFVSKKVNLKNLNNPNTLPATLTGLGVDLGDFAVRLF